MRGQNCVVGWAATISRTTPTADAQLNQPSLVAGPQVVLVHGANHGAWCWDPIVERLQAVGVGSWAIDLPFTSFLDDVEQLRRAVTVAAGYGPVTVVSHSYSGLVAAAGGHAADRLIFVCARLPRPGQSPSALTPQWGFPEFTAGTIVLPDGWFSLSAAAGRLLYSGTAAAQAEPALARLRPMRSRVPDDPIVEPAWLQVPSSYVVCAGDQVVRPSQQRDCAALVERSIELDCDHSPFYSAPAELADFILQEVSRL